MPPRSLRLVPALAALVTALSPAAAEAAVPHTGNTWLPANGAELLEAVSAVNAITATAAATTQQIKLTPTTYTLTAPLQLNGNTPIEIVGDAAGGTIITNGANAPAPLITSVDREDEWPVELRDLQVDVRGTSSATFAAVSIGARVVLKEVTVDVPSTAPSVTGVQLRTESAANGLTVTSEATAAPAVRAEPESDLFAFAIEGGEPSLQIADGPGFRRSVTVRRGRIAGGPTTQRVLTTAGSADELTVNLAGVELWAGDETETVIDVAGATGSTVVGTGTTVNLRGLTTVGGPATTADVRVAPGTAGSRTDIQIEGLLSLGTAPAIACGPGGPALLMVDVRGIYSEGPLDPAPGCTIDENGRRTGDPKFRDRAAGDLEPLWGSVLIDGAPQYPSPDARGQERPSDKGFGPVDAWTGDIGAIEYQYTPALLEEVAFDEPGNRGLVRLEALAHDLSDEEDAKYGVTYRWRFSDGTEQFGQSVEHRFALPSGVKFADFTASVEVTAIDVSGAEDSVYVPLEPWIATCEPATDSDTYERGEPCPEVDPTPTPAATPIATATPAPSKVPLAAATPKPAAPLLGRFEVIRARTSLASRRATGIANSRPSEASVRLGLADSAKLTVRASRLKGTKATPVKGASITFDTVAGRRILRVTPRIGTARLRRGLYVISVEVRPFSGGTTAVRTFNLRVVK
ncbi:MAG: hypothetical protein J7513_18610 [Solirubrobacteraceae bacterium]|nr:hypothetical protein [Solirubrobacteraceae bacterium]